MAVPSLEKSPMSKWSRFWRSLAKIGETLSLDRESWQDERIACVEAELQAVQNKIIAFEQEREKRLTS